MDELELRRSLNNFHTQVADMKDKYHSAFKHNGIMFEVNEFTADLQEAFTQSVRGDLEGLYVAATQMRRSLEGHHAQHVLNALNEMEPLRTLAGLKKITVHPNAEKLEADLQDAAQIDLE